jgi:cellulose synthase/poly-beta-1,6-N-acetylglucosamine synthase-like glycosyltransferase
VFGLWLNRSRRSLDATPHPLRKELVDAKRKTFKINPIVMISFIVPAHNEQAGIGRTLQAIHDSARAVGQPYEIIVVDDASTESKFRLGRK